MKKTLVVLTLLLLMSLAGFSQSTVQKLPGEATIFTWNFLAADEPKINGFKLYSSPVQSGPFNNLAGTAAATTSRNITISASFSAGTVRTFYVIRSYVTSAAGSVESGDSNSVEVEMRVPSPSSLQVK